METKKDASKKNDTSLAEVGVDGFEPPTLCL